MPDQRRSAFRRIHEHQQQTSPQSGVTPAREPLTTIPLTKKKERNRTWDSAHPINSYYIPDHILEEAKNVRDEIAKIAEENMANTTNVAKVLLEYALKNVRKGELVISAQPNPNRRKMTVTLVDADEWPKKKGEKSEAIHPRQKHKVNRTDKFSRLGYRWGADVDKQIGALAGAALSKGEVAVFLLHYALTAYDKGRVKFVAHPVQVKQRIMLSA